MKISKLVFQKQVERVSVFLDGEFAFGISTEVALQHRLKINQELGDDIIFELLFESLRLELTSQTLGLIGLRPHSLTEIKNYIKKRLVVYQQKQMTEYSKSFYTKIQAKPDTLINQIIGKLEANGFINDEEFAKWWIEQRIHSKPRGKYALQVELIQKGIPKEIISSVLADKSVITRDTSSQMIDTLLDKAWRSIQSRGYDNRKIKQVLAQRLLSKGFSWDEVRGKIDDFMPRVVQSNPQKK